MIRYRAYLDKYPDVTVSIFEPFVVTIDIETTDEVLNFTGIEPFEPGWLSILEDQEYRYGEKKRYYYDLGDIVP